MEGDETTIKLAESIDNVTEEGEPTIEMVEGTMAIISDPSLQLFHSLEGNQNEMSLRSKLFHSIKNSPTMPYSPRT